MENLNAARTIIVIFGVLYSLMALILGLKWKGVLALEAIVAIPILAVSVTVGLSIVESFTWQLIGAAIGVIIHFIYTFILYPDRGEE